MHRVLRILMIAAVFAISTSGQQRATPDVVFSRSWIPSDFWRPLESLGKRVQFPGNERTVMTGQFTDAEGSRPAVLTQQLPALVRFEGVNRGGGPLLFDGERTGAGLSPAQEDVIESVVLDTPEGLFSTIRQAGAARLIGRNFGPDPKREPNYDGSRYDVYELAAPARTRRDGVLRSKRYYFDAKTGLLESTRYSDRRAGRAVRVETRFSSWTTVSGSSYPRLIERHEDGQFVFRFSVSAVTSGPPQNIKFFRIP